MPNDHPHGGSQMRRALSQEHQRVYSYPWWWLPWIHCFHWLWLCIPLTSPFHFWLCLLPWKLGRYFVDVEEATFGYTVFNQSWVRCNDSGLKRSHLALSPLCRDAIPFPNFWHSDSALWGQSRHDPACSECNVPCANQAYWCPASFHLPGYCSWTHRAWLCRNQLDGRRHFHQSAGSTKIWVIPFSSWSLLIPIHTLLISSFSSFLLPYNVHLEEEYWT